MRRSGYLPTHMLTSATTQYGTLCVLAVSLNVASSITKAAYIYMYIDPVCAMQAYRGRRGIAPLILKLSAKWSTFKFTFLPFRSGRTNPVPLNRRLPGLQIQSRHFVEYTHLLLLPGCERGRSTAPGYTHNIGCRVLAMCLAAVWL